MKVKMIWGRWSFTTIVFSIVCQGLSQPFEHKSSSTKTTPSNSPKMFSPRMDYDEWTPLGHGDPLKNDPTFDYVPPVLDRVQYWLDSQSSTEASLKRDILVLGVTAKKTSPKIPNHYLKFVDGPKFTRHHYHHQQKPQDDNQDYRKDFASPDPEPVKIVRTNFRHGPVGIGTGNPLDFRNQNQIQGIPVSYYPSSYYNEKSKPYTMMMPPPIQQSDIRHDLQSQYGIQTETPISILMDLDDKDQTNPSPRPLHSQSIDNDEPTPSSISFSKSHLVYQSSQTFNHWAPTNNMPGQFTWNTSDDNKSHDHYEDHNVAASVNHEVVIGQNANIIVDGDSTDNEQVVLGRKEIPPVNNNSYHDDRNNDKEIKMTKMHIVLANKSSVFPENNDEALKNVTVTVIVPSNYEVPVNNSKNSLKITRVESTTPISTSSSMMVSPLRQYLNASTVSVQLPRFPTSMPIQSSGNRPLHQFLSNMTVTLPSDNLTSMTTPGQHLNVEQDLKQTIPENVHSQSLATTQKYKTSLSPKLSTSSTSTTTPPSIIKSTTDPILSRYQQSSELSQPPMFLIIQGHSKVKTYKATVNKYGEPVEKNSIDVDESTTKRFISKFEQFVNDNTRVVSTTRRSIAEDHEVKAKEKRVERATSLLNFVESGLSAFTASLSSSPSHHQQHHHHHHRRNLRLSH